MAQQLAASQKPVSELPARQRADSKKDKLKKDLGKLIHKYEKRQYRWGSPRKAASMDHLLPLPSRYPAYAASVFLWHFRLGA